MKVLAVCKVCFDDRMGREAYAEPNEVMYSELQDSGIAIDTCSKGHRFAVVHQGQKFEILFESGALALIDGYPREAVSSFAAALERCYEFYIRIVARKYKIETESFDSFWKEVSNQSERQYGAFCTLYLLEMGKPFRLPSDTITLLARSHKIVEFRNKVVHQGVMPDRNEAAAYGQKVLEVMNLIVGPLLETNNEVIREYVFEQMKAKVASVPDGLPWLNQGWITFMIDISHNISLDTTTPFSERLEHLREVILEFTTASPKLGQQNDP